MLFFSISEISFAQLADSPWPIYRQNSQRSGKSNNTGPETGTLAWMVEFDEDKISPVVVDSNGIIYVNSEKHLYALYPGGHIKWKYPFSQYLKESLVRNESIPAPLINKDGTVYVHHADSIFAISPEGNYRWAYYLGKPPRHYPTIDKNGNINLVERVLSPTGQLVWEMDIRTSSGVVCTDTIGTMYWAATGNFYAVNPDGTIKWQYPANMQIIFLVSLPLQKAA